jgi:hypothetical protein
LYEHFYDHNEYLILDQWIAREELMMNSKQIDQTGNTKSAQTRRSLTRRDFLRLTLVTAGAIAVGRAVPVLAGRATTDHGTHSYPTRRIPKQYLSRSGTKFSGRRRWQTLVRAGV